jgi:hypothetical protein
MYYNSDDGVYLLCETHNAIVVNLGYYARIEDVIKAWEAQKGQ